MILFGILCLCFVLFEVAWLRYNGSPVQRPDTPRQVQTTGQGTPLRFAVLGDSTSVSQGSAYDEGYVMAAVNYLGQTHTVTWANFGVSGARAADVAASQAPKAAELAADMALVAVGANDATHLTDVAEVRASLVKTISTLRGTNPDVRIIVTGSPDMGSPRRLPQPLRWLAGKRTQSLNTMVVELARQERLTFAPIAARTGPAFREDPTLFAADNFHPNARGYALWNLVVIEAVAHSLDQ
jgi:lysophospholipase L1-like esterase